MYSRREWIVLAAGAAFTTQHRALRAQDQEPTFSTSVKVVNVLASVHDKQGRLVRDLNKEDFEIAENGRSQAIQYFARESDLPLTLGLMVDTSMSQEHVMSAERAASLRFLDRVLREGKDHVFVMQFDLAVRLAQPLTSSRGELERVLAFVDTPTRAELRNQAGGGTLLFDAVVGASDDIMRPQQGRKAMIILSDGGENGSDATLGDAIDAANRAGALIYSILFGGTEGKGILERMSRETGGAFFEVTKKQPIDQVFDLIQDELRTQYNLGYVSDSPARSPEFRRIQLTTREKGLVVQARNRYWAEP